MALRDCPRGGRSEGTKLHEVVLTHTAYPSLARPADRLSGRMAGMPSRPSLPPTRRLVSERLREALGGQSQVRAYYDEDEQNVVAVVEAASTPSPALSTFATASLHASPNHLDDRDIRVELLVVAENQRFEAANMVATSAFFVMKNRWLAAPGVVFPNAVSEYLPQTTVPHLMWVEPFDFEGLSTVRVDGISEDVHVLQGVPLADSERDFLGANGFDALEERLDSAQVAHYDFDRPAAC